jgi:hypothetical protein
MTTRALTLRPADAIFLHVAHELAVLTVKLIACYNGALKEEDIGAPLSVIEQMQSTRARDLWRLMHARADWTPNDAVALHEALLALADWAGEEYGAENGEIPVGRLLDGGAVLRLLQDLEEEARDH